MTPEDKEKYITIFNSLKYDSDRYDLSEILGIFLDGCVIGQQQGMEESAKICDKHARSYGAINESVTTEHRVKDYAIEGAIRSIQRAIRQAAKELNK